MARIRTVKPDFFRHVGLYDAEMEEGLPLRVAFAGLWTAADREGRFIWEPRNLKFDCLPHDDVDFSRVLDALWTRGFVVKYEVGGKFFGAIPSWRSHQVINNRETPSVLPEPNENNMLLTREPRVDDACGTPLVHIQGEGKGREGKGREGKGKETRAVARAADAYAFEGEVIRLSQRHFDQWTRAYPQLDLTAELTARDAWLSSPDASDEDRKKWFYSTPQLLANRNQRAKTAGAYEKPMTDAERAQANALRGVEIWKPGAA